MAVFVLDKNKKPLMPCSEKRARLLLHSRRARVHRVYPFTIRLVDRTRAESLLQPLRLKLDPGSKVTGVAVVRTMRVGQQVLHLAEVEHRGNGIRKLLQQRAASRRRRRSANLRYRAPRFDNRRRPEGWLASSLQHRVDTVLSWVARYRRLAAITAITLELVRFDTQQLVDPEITGVEYQQGTLAGYELREYLLEKWGRRCAYCETGDVPLQIEHIRPKSIGGSDQVSNLTLSCAPCDAKKGTTPIREFLADQPDRLTRILAQAQQPLRDAAAVNATRWTLCRRLTQTGLPVETSTGGRTKWNRARLSIPKTHALDAACTGSVVRITRWKIPILRIRCTGRGSHQRTRLTAHGFPRGYLSRVKTVHGFRTGALVQAILPTGRHAGTHTGRVAVRATGSFNLQTATGTLQGIRWSHCRLLQRADGYGYHLTPRPSSLGSKPRVSGPRCTSSAPLTTMEIGKA
ncbi:MAG: RNA-guided endonuclease IscB [Candidatus Methylomirabilales bacterium]